MASINISTEALKDMRRFLVTAATVLVAGIACAQYKTGKTPTTPQPTIVTTPATESLDSARRVPRDVAIKLVEEKKAVWVDVRPKGEYESGHIKGAANIPLAEIITRLRELPPNKFIITYCA